jgi:hypothetical protein
MDSSIEQMPGKPTLLKTVVQAGLRFLRICWHIAKTTTPSQRPHLFTGLWFFVCAWIAINIYAIDPDMTVWNVIGYSLAASFIYGLIGACFATTILYMDQTHLALFRIGFRGAICGLLFTLIMIFIVPLYLVLTHAIPMPNTQETEQLLLMYGIVVPFAFVCLPAILVGAITTILLRLFHVKCVQPKKPIIVEA